MIPYWRSSKGWLCCLCCGHWWWWPCVRQGERGSRSSDDHEAGAGKAVVRVPDREELCTTPRPGRQQLLGMYQLVTLRGMEKKLRASEAPYPPATGDLSDLEGGVADEHDEDLAADSANHRWCRNSSERESGDVSMRVVMTKHPLLKVPSQTLSLVGSFPDPRSMCRYHCPPSQSHEAVFVSLVSVSVYSGRGGWNDEQSIHFWAGLAVLAYHVCAGSALIIDGDGQPQPNIFSVYFFPIRQNRRGPAATAMRKVKLNLYRSTSHTG